MKAPKPTELPKEIDVVKDDTEKTDEKFAKALASKARELAHAVEPDAEGFPVVGVVVNRVLTARAVYELLLAEAKPEEKDAPAAQ